MSVEILLGKQNRDGGWPYVRGASWTEPTVYAILALLAEGDTQTAGRGLRWLPTVQRPDGGWSPRAGVEESTWVTALVALLPRERLGREAHARAIQWLLCTQGRESTISYRLREWLLGNRRPDDQQFPGWPWIPGTAAWVGTTALAILALEKEARRRPSPAIAERVAEGRGFLRARMVPGRGVGGLEPGRIDAFKAAFQRLKEKDGLYVHADYGVGFVGRSLFRASIRLPANVPVGPLAARTYLFHDGELLSAQTTRVVLRRSGLERIVYDMAFEYPAAYGALSVVFAAAVSLLASWLMQRFAR